MNAFSQSVRSFFWIAVFVVSLTGASLAFAQSLCRKGCFESEAYAYQPAINFELALRGKCYINNQMGETWCDPDDPFMKDGLGWARKPKYQKLVNPKTRCEATGNMVDINSCDCDLTCFVYDPVQKKNIGVTGQFPQEGGACATTPKNVSEKKKGACKCS